MYLFIWHLRVTNAGVAKLYFVLNAQPENSNWNSTVPLFEFFWKYNLYFKSVNLRSIESDSKGNELELTCEFFITIDDNNKSISCSSEMVAGPEDSLYAYMQSPPDLLHDCIPPRMHCLLYPFSILSLSFSILGLG